MNPNSGMLILAFLNFAGVLCSPVMDAGLFQKRNYFLNLLLIL